MRNIILFIRRYFTLLCFLALQALALWMLYSYNKFYHARGLGVASEITGWFNTRYNKIENFLHQSEENKHLLAINDSLQNLLAGNFIQIDSSGGIIRTDSTFRDSTGKFRQYRWFSAEVVRNQVNQDKNFIQISGGKNQGFMDNMGVFSSNGGLVGVIVNVSSNYSQVMSLLNVQNRVNAQLKRTGSSGSLYWDGKDPRFLLLNNIPKSDSVRMGDSIVTGNFSLSYPPGKMIGLVEEVIPELSTNFALLKIRSTANFHNLQQVQVVKNLAYEEQQELINNTNKKVIERK